MEGGDEPRWGFDFAKQNKDEVMIYGVKGLSRVEKKNVVLAACLFGFVKLGVECANVFGALATGHKALLRERNEEVEGRCDSGGDSFRNNAVVGVVNCDGSSAVNLRRRGFRNEEKPTLVELRGGGGGRWRYGV